MLAQALHNAFGVAGDDTFQWLAVTHPVWARELARRLEKVQQACQKAEAAP